LRIDKAGTGGIDFRGGFAFGCVSNSYADVGFYDINTGIDIGLFANDPDLNTTKDWYNMDFGPDYNGDGVCDMYLVRYFSRLSVYDGNNGSKLADLFPGSALRSVSGVLLPDTNPPPNYLILK
jgi:hypothetical protein